jgi:hypothetical protein
MPIKRRETVVIACVTFETVKVVEPVKNLKPDRVVLLYWGKSDEEAKREIYLDFIREVREQLDAAGFYHEDREIRVYDFKEMLRELISILKTERKLGSEVYLNLSSGPQNYAAAAMVATMMFGGHPFFVATKEFFVKGEAYYDKGKPVGITRSIGTMDEISIIPLKPPPEDLVQGLALLNELAADGPVGYRKLIEGLKQENLIGKRRKEKPKFPALGDHMYFRRHFMEKWIARGWVEREENRLKLTTAGEMVVNVFAGKKAGRISEK